MPNDDPSKVEILKQKVEVWKTTVITQQHFNTLQVQLRNFALTVYVAILAAVGFCLKEHAQVSILGINGSSATLACLAGILAMFGFYYTDWGYLQLLKSAVKKGEEIEKGLATELPDVGLATAITTGSSAKRFLKVFPTSSSSRLAWFYSLLLGSLAITTVVTFFVHAPNGETDQAVANGKGKAKDQVTIALRDYYGSGHHLLDVAQAAELGKKRIDERLTTIVAGRKPAIVFDVDETALSMWPFLAETNFQFDDKKFGEFAQTGSAPAIAPVRDLFRYAQSKGIAVFFVSGRSAQWQGSTEANLKAAGFEGFQELAMRPIGERVASEDFKERIRHRIRESGYEILLTVGGQVGDHDDPTAKGALLIPNPFFKDN